MDAEAKPTAHGLIQGYLGPDHKVRIAELLVCACASLKAARAKGQSDSFEFR